MTSPPAAVAPEAGAAEPPIPWLRIAALSLPPLLVSLWLSVPALQPAVRELRGTVSTAQACLVLCARVVEVAGHKLNCTADLLGVPYDCQPSLGAPGAAMARYAVLPSLAGVFGLAPTDGTLLRLEREGRVVYARSLSQQVWGALYGGWVFHAVYWPLVGLAVWRWPASRLARRVGAARAPP